MSFMLTTDQIRHGTKTVTRRRGWKFLKPGDRVMACVKCQGLGPGGKIEKIRPIEIVSVTFEPLKTIIRAPFRNATHDECTLEGFPGMTPSEFVSMFCKSMQCVAIDIVTRIQFKYLEVQS